ncbi:MAG: hypothetical protein KF750_00015 [Xanthobacteraceae bacterium]|nr:hypothetical protein [Xanthobacteraceae bacterium]
MHPDKIFLTVNGRKRSLSWLIENAANATDVRVINNSALTALPDLPNATDVWVENNSALTALPWLVVGEKHSRGYHFNGIKIRGEWRIIAGCRNFSVTSAKKHWRHNHEALSIVEKIAAEISKRETDEIAA